MSWTKPSLSVNPGRLAGGAYPPSARRRLACFVIRHSEGQALTGIEPSLPPVVGHGISEAAE